MKLEKGKEMEEEAKEEKRMVDRDKMDERRRA
jgi:hypothetical protein